MSRNARWLALALSALAITGCGRGGEGDPPPPDEPERLVAMGLHDLGLAKSIEVSKQPARPVERQLNFACGDAPFQFVRSDGRLVFCSSARTFSIDPTLSEKPRLVARGLYFVPEQDGILWLVDRPKVKRVTVEGEVLDRGLVRHCFVAVATEAGPICQGRSRHLEVIDIESGRPIRRLPGRFPAANGNTVAACDEPCRKLYVSNAATGDSRSIEAPEPLEFDPTYDARFSPDGSKLATPVFTEPIDREKRFPEQNRPTGIAIVELESGETSLVPEAKPDGVYGHVAWSSDGEHLYFSGKERGSIFAHDLTTGETELVPFDLKDTIFQLAAF